MTIAWICKSYSVPAEIGGRVEYSGNAKREMGTITGTQGPHLLIRMDGSDHARPYHPTWKLRYLDGGRS